MRAPTRDTVIAIFEKHRAAPGTPFDESHFLDYLLAVPKGKGHVRNSFGGLRRFNAFLDEIQYEFGVCFSQDDRERAYSLDAFIERIRELQRSRSGSLRSLANREKAGAGWHVLFFADALLLVVATIFRDIRWFAAGLVVAALVITVAFIRFAHKEKTRLRRLRARIEGTE